MKRRNTIEHMSVIAYMQKGETYAQAKARLDAAWQSGLHPGQQHITKRERRARNKAMKRETVAE